MQRARSAMDDLSDFSQLQASESQGTGQGTFQISLIEFLGTGGTSGDRSINSGTEPSQYRAKLGSPRHKCKNEAGNSRLDDPRTTNSDHSPEDSDIDNILPSPIESVSGDSRDTRPKFSSGTVASPNVSTLPSDASGTPQFPLPYPEDGYSPARQPNLEESNESLIVRQHKFATQAFYTNSAMC